MASRVTNGEFSYIGRKDCGCIVAMTVIDGSERVATADLTPTQSPPKLKVDGCTHGKVGASLL